MNHEHIPGPWAANQDSGMDHVIVTDGLTIASTSFEIHNQEIGMPKVSEDTAVATARLLAAAPEMLEVLLGIEQWQEGHDNEFHTLAADILEKLRSE